MSQLQIDYYCDVLCVWAWIAQRRLQELREEWGDQIELRFHYLPIFCDVESRIQDKWSAKSGYEGFGRHVLEASAPYELAPVNRDVWKYVRPKTSSNAHLLLKAAQISHVDVDLQALTQTIQGAFFEGQLDIGLIENVLLLMKQKGLDETKLKSSLNDGSAMAALMQDYQQAHELNIKGSPTFIMNSGRQELFGNVGYRILSANIKEILDKPQHQASWC